MKFFFFSVLGVEGVFITSVSLVCIMVNGVFLCAVLSVQVMDRASGEFARAQVLARKMALNLGIDGAKNREAVVNIHR